MNFKYMLVLASALFVTGAQASDLVGRAMSTGTLDTSNIVTKVIDNGKSAIIYLNGKNPDGSKAYYGSVTFVAPNQPQLEIVQSATDKSRFSINTVKDGKKDQFVGDLFVKP